MNKIGLMIGVIAVLGACSSPQKTSETTDSLMSEVDTMGMEIDTMAMAVDSMIMEVDSIPSGQ